MKLLGLSILCVGVGIAAAFGARNNQPIQDRSKESLILKKLQGQAESAAGDYTNAVKELTKHLDVLTEHYPERPEFKSMKAGLLFTIGEDSPTEIAEENTEENTEKAGHSDKVLLAGFSFSDEDTKVLKEVVEERDEARSAVLHASAIERWSMETARASCTVCTPLDLPEQIGQKRSVWLKKMNALIGPLAKARTQIRPPAPSKRLSDWFSLAGLGFLMGVILIIVGGLVTRRAIKSDLAEEGNAEGEKPLDFGQAIANLREEISGMVEEMTPHLEDWPDEDRFEEIKEKLESLHSETLEPLLQTGPRLQALYGMAGFAAVFGPLSGAERLMNRAWSALVDRHWTEATNSLSIAAENLKNTHNEIARLSSERAA